MSPAGLFKVQKVKLTLPVISYQVLGVLLVLVWVFVIPHFPFSFVIVFLFKFLIDQLMMLLFFFEMESHVVQIDPN